MRDAELNNLPPSATESPRGYSLRDGHPAKVAGKANPRAQKDDLLAQKTILVVDDDSLVRGVTRRVLARQGYTILEAAAGQQALATCLERDGKIDLLLTDVVMPEMSGFELAKAVKARYPGMPVLYISGYAEEAVVSAQFAKLQATFLRKPFTLPDLIGRVAEMLAP